MCYWDDGDYFEPSEFDEKIEELKNELRESVKKEINDEIEKLRKENKELQGIKRNFESVKKDFERKKDECDRAIRNAESKAKQLFQRKIDIRMFSYHSHSFTLCHSLTTFELMITLLKDEVNT